MRNLVLTLALATLLGLTALFSGCSPEIRTPEANDCPLITKYTEPAPTPAQATDFVNLKEYIPELDIELAYYTENNFTGQKIYDDPTAYLRRGTADKLRKVSGEVAQDGYRLKIWDAHRPHRAQHKLWEVMPDSRYVANPHKGFSTHSRGCAVDLTLVNATGQELDMPSSFDEFTPRANRDYSDVSPAQAANSRYLEEVMVRHGFVSITYEWWHFVDADREMYNVAEEVVLCK